MNEVVLEQLVGIHYLGLVFGTFAPLHIGHLDIITQAKRENDGVLVIVSGRDGDRGDTIGLDLHKRYMAVKKALKHVTHAVVSELNENDIPIYPDGWIEWLRYLDTAIEQHIVGSDQVHIVVYCGEEIYKEKINELRPEWEVRLMDRAIIPLSATMIRQNPQRYWRQIARPFRQYFMRKILILDSESNRAKDLAQDLSLVFGVSLEVAESADPLFFTGKNTLDRVDEYDQILVIQGTENELLYQKAVQLAGMEKVHLIGKTMDNETLTEAIYREAKHYVYPLVKELDVQG